MRISDWSSDVCSSDLLARCDNRFARVRLRHALRAMAVRIDVRRAIVRSEGSERPDHIDQKFMRPLFAGPHIMVAVRELPDFTRMDFDRLRDIEIGRAHV